MDTVEAHISTLSVSSRVLVPPPCLHCPSHLSSQLPCFTAHHGAYRRLAQSPHPPHRRHCLAPAPLRGTSQTANNLGRWDEGGRGGGTSRGVGTGGGGEEGAWPSTSTSPAAGLSVVHLSGGEGETQASHSALCTTGVQGEEEEKEEQEERSPRYLQCSRNSYFIFMTDNRVWAFFSLAMSNMVMS